MLRFAILLLIVCLLFRWAFGQWPWQAMQSPPTRQQALHNARKLLGVDRHASKEQIVTAHKRLIAMVHPDKGGSNKQVHEANDARDLLLGELPSQGADVSPGDN